MSFDMNKKKRIIVTGATGFVGQHLVPLLLQLNYQVIVVIRDIKVAEQFAWFTEVDYLIADLRNLQVIPTEHLGCDVIHLAWYGLPNYHSLDHIEINLPMSYRFIKLMVENGSKNVFVAGTCSEYGLAAGEISARRTPTPVTSYGIAKMQLHQQLKCLQKEINFRLQWARLFYMYGDGQSESSVLKQLHSAINSGNKKFDMSGGEQLRDYLHISRVVQLILSVINTEKNITCNICSGEPISIRRLVEDQITKYQADISLNLGCFPYPDYEPMAFWGKPFCPDDPT